ncbi:MAG: hypothetical protein ABL908_08335 [Hyphomicrobium sp.]
MAKPSEDLKRERERSSRRARFWRKLGRGAFKLVIAAKALVDLINFIKRFWD